MRSWLASHRAWVEIASVALIMLVAAALDTHRIGRQSIWYDEAVSVSVAGKPWGDFWRIVGGQEAVSGLYYLGLRAWTILGTGEGVVRALSAGCMVAAVGVLFLVGRRLFGTWAGLIAALLLAQNAFIVHYAQEARSYALATLAITLASLALVRALERQSTARWSLYALVSLAALYAHFLTAEVLVAHAVVVGVFGIRRIRWRLAAPGIVAGLLGMAPLAFNILTVSPQRTWVPELTTNTIRATLETAVGGATAPGSGGLTLLAAYALLGAVAGVAAFRAIRRDRGLAWRYALAGGWAVIPFGVSAAVAPFQATFVSRYLIWAVPGLALLAASGLAAWRPRWTAVVAVVLMAALASRGLQHWYQAPYKEDWRGATAQVMRNAEPGDAIVFYEPWGWQPFDYYVARQGAAAPPPKRFRMPDGAGAIRQKAKDLANRYARVWLVLDAVSLRPPPATVQLIHRMLSTRYKLVEYRRFYRLEVRLYVRLP